MSEEQSKDQGSYSTQFVVNFYIELSLKKKRDEYTIQIRKDKRLSFLLIKELILFRHEVIEKRRRKNLENDMNGQEGAVSAHTHNLATDETLKQFIDEWLKRDFDMSEFVKLVEAANSNDRIQQHYGVIGLRKILSTGSYFNVSNLITQFKEKGPPIQPVIDANMIPRLIQFMAESNEPHLQVFEIIMITFIQDI